MLNPSLGHTKESWSLYTLSGDGDLEYEYSECYSQSYLKENILPLDGEMAWDARSKPKLDVAFHYVGAIQNIELYDVIQRYGDHRLIKLLAFSNAERELCPFYAWQPIEQIKGQVRSKVTSFKGRKFIGHDLELYKNRDHTLFTVNNHRPVRLDIDGSVVTYLSKHYPEMFNRYSTFDLETFAYKVSLAKKSDPMCCSTGPKLSLSISIDGAGVIVAPTEQ